jgi:DNA helicase IV
MAVSMSEALRLAGEDYLVGLVVAPFHLQEMTALARLRSEVGIIDLQGITQPVTLMGAAAVKGLEFDAVVVVEPAAIAGREPRGLRSTWP